MDYRFLHSDDLPQLHRAYLEAFSDYVIKIQPTREQILRVLVRNGFRWDLSVGVFAGDDMIAFTANGFDDWEGQPTAYDSGTGVIPQYRRHGLASRMFDFVLPRLKEEGISQYLLEVISSNEPALKLYRKLGFEETRSVEVLALDQQSWTSNPVRQRDELKIVEVAAPDWKLFQSFWSCGPSWQNSINAVERSLSVKLLLGAYLDEQCVGYGVVSPSSGDIPQLAVAPHQRRQGIGSALLNALQSHIAPDKTTTMNNIDSSAEETLAFCAARGFKRVVSQFEMMMKL
jgi:ribosomal protein S18 acetylase RimI-like enzyme